MKITKIRFYSLIILLLILMAGCTSKISDGTKAGDNSPSPTATATPTPTPEPITYTAGYQFEAPKAGDTVAIMKTSMGDIKIKLFPEEAPKAVENFVTHAKNGYYDNLIFHRVINDFMIQGGDPLGNGTGGESIWGEPFEDEFSLNLLNYRGALSMANSGEDTNGSQFFIVQRKVLEDEDIDYLKNSGYPTDIIKLYEENGGTEWLDFKHTVFGHVYEGMDIVDNIATVEVNQDDKPVEDVVIQAIEIVEFGG